MFRCRCVFHRFPKLDLDEVMWLESNIMIITSRHIDELKDIYRPLKQKCLLTWNTIASSHFHNFKQWCNLENYSRYILFSLHIKISCKENTCAYCITERNLKRYWSFHQHRFEAWLYTLINFHTKQDFSLWYLHRAGVFEQLSLSREAGITAIFISDLIFIRAVLAKDKRKMSLMVVK